jgi:putative heme transporter
MPAGPSPLVPRWLLRSAAVGWRVLAAAGMVLVLWIVVSSIPVSAAAILVSLVVAAAIAPTAIRLRARGMSRSVAAALAFGAGAVLIVGAALILLALLAPDVRAVAGAVGQGIAVLRDRLAEAGGPGTLADVLDRLAASARSELVPDLGSVAGTVVNVGTVLVLGTFLTFFLLADGDRAAAWLLRSVGPAHVEAVAASARTGLDHVAWYVRRTVVLAAVDGVVTGVVLGIAGIPLAGALAAVAFLAGLVPYLGAIAGATVIGLAAFALGGPLPAIAVLAALVAASIVASRLLEATAMNRAIDVNPVVVLVAIPAGSALFGVLGLLAVLPVTVFGLAVWRSVIAALDLGPAGVPEGLAGGAPVGGAPAGGASVGDAGAAPARPPDLPDGVPAWLDRVAQWSWRGLVLSGLAWLGIVVVEAISTVVVPAVMAVVGAATLLPLVARLAGRGWGRGRASAAATVGSAIAIAAICLAALAMTLGPLRSVIEAAVAGASAIDLAWLADAVAQAGSGLQVDLAAMFAGLFGLALGVVLVVLMTFFFLRDGGGWWRAVLGRVPPGRRAPMAEAGRRAVDVLTGYMLGTAIISAFGAVTTSLILVVLGLPFALPIAVISFFAGFIPYVGSFLSTGLALLVVIALGDTTDVVVMLVFTVIFNIAQGNFVTPLVYGRSLSLHPAVVLMAIPIGNEIAGLLGMFLVVPAAAMVAATWRLVIAAIDETGLPPDSAASPSGAADPPGEPAAVAAAPAGP